MIVYLYMRKHGNEGSSRLAGPGPQWGGVAPWGKIIIYLVCRCGAGTESLPRKQRFKVRTAGRRVSVIPAFGGIWAALDF